MSEKSRVTKRSVSRAIVVVLLFAIVAELLQGEGSFRLLGVGEFVLAFTLMLAGIGLMTWVEPRWAESLTFGVTIGVLGLLGDLFYGEGFDWLFFLLAVTGGTLGWFIALWLHERFVRWRMSRATSKRATG